MSEQVPSPEIAIKLHELHSWSNNRESQYGGWGKQHNLL